MEFILTRPKLSRLFSPLIMMSRPKTNEILEMPSDVDFLAQKWFLRKIENISTTDIQVHHANSCEQNTFFEFFDNGMIKVGIFGKDSNGNCILTNTKNARYKLNNYTNQIIINKNTKEDIFEIERLTEHELVFIIDLKQKFYLETRQ